MKVYIVTLITVLLSLQASNLKAQRIFLDLGYQYLNNQHFNRLIEYHNFSRPFVENKHPTLSNGIAASLSYLLSKDKKINSGIKSGISHTESVTFNNESFVNFYFQTLDLGYLLKYTGKEKFENWKTEISFSVIGGFMKKKVDGKRFTVDGEKLIAYHIGGITELKISYKLYAINRVNLSPFIGAAYSPYLSNSNAEAVINQTSSLIEEESNSFFTLNAGVRLSIGPKRVHFPPNH